MAVRGPEDEGAGGGGGGGSTTGDQAGGTGTGQGGLDPDIQRQIDEIVNQRTAGLKANNEALKREKQQLAEGRNLLQQQFEALGGEEGIAKLRELQANIAKNEEMKLLADGEYEKVIEQRTANLKRSYEGQVTALNEKIAELEQKHAQVYQDLLDHRLGSEISKACDEVGITGAGQRRDASREVKELFSWDDERGTFVLKDRDGTITFGKNANDPITVSEWLADRRLDTAYDHWWPASATSPANGRGRMLEGDSLMKQLESGNMDHFRAMRAKMNEGRIR